MPPRTDIRRVLVIGSGPIVIGQACEFDYSGTQACKALRAEGLAVVLVNSNPATIMTDPDIADRTYVEPLTPETLEAIIDAERPDALLPTVGGQTGLNLAVALAERGTLERYGVKLIGASLDAIKVAEERLTFREAMRSIGIAVPTSGIARSLEQGLALISRVGFPAIIRPSFTLGGVGAGIAYNIHEYRDLVALGLSLSPAHEVLIEQSVIGWKEFELEVMRDAADNFVVVCSIENVDPMGIHTGDSITVAPAMTLSDKEYQRMRDAAKRIIRRVGVETGGSNIQFAVNPDDGRMVAIEMNPRVSRSSALASKATGFPIAQVSAKLAGGLTLDEIPYWRDGTLEKYTPSGDYVVVKFARWAFEKFRGAEDKLGTQMRAVGEVMSIGKTYKEAFQKAIRSLETGRYGLGFAKDFRRRSLDDLLSLLVTPSSERQFVMYEALRKGASVEELQRLTHIKAWFIGQMKELVDLEEQILAHKGGALPESLLRRAKQDGFADRYLARLLGVDERAIRDRRRALGIVQAWDAVPVSGVDHANYYYSTYNGADKVPVSGRRKVMILGGGPNRIGQGIEFDYCCVHAALTLRDLGYETIMVNCNPETVSTDYDTSDKLYFEPLTVEDVLSIYEKEKPEGVIVQFGGQTPLNIAAELQQAGVRILGTSVETIQRAEDRDLFRKAMERMGIAMPEAGMAGSLAEAMTIAGRIGYPLIVRPSFVLGGRGMEVVNDEESLRDYAAKAVEVTPEHPILIDRFLADATECEADAIADGDDAFVPAIMEHIEYAGVHSGDSSCVIPPVSISAEHVAEIDRVTRRIARELHVVGLMNIQYAIEKGKLFVLEANPRASRTVPLVSKVCNIQMARLATELMMGKRLGDLKLERKVLPHFGVKAAVFPFDKMPEVDPLLGPEMRSTGEVLGIADSFGLAFFKAQEAAKPPLPAEGTVLISLIEKNALAVEIGREFAALGFRIRATRGTAALLAAHGITAEPINKVHEGRPHIVDAIMNREIQLVVNTPAGRRSEYDDSYIRKTAIKYQVPYFTTLPAALASARGIAAYRQGGGGVTSLQEYHDRIPR